MEEIVFNPSEKPTVGIEIEAQLVDKDSGNLVNIAEGIINAYDNDERVKHELYLSTVEVTSSPLMNTNDTYKEMTSILKDKNTMDVKKEMTTEVLQLSKVNDAPPKDQQKLVREMRQTLGPNFATMSLIMAARTQVDVMNNLFIDPEAGETTEDPENSSNFFKEIYAPFMDALVKGNSTMSKINDHARTVPPCEQCFFCLLILVTFIYGIGIFTAVLLLASMMWYT